MKYCSKKLLSLIIGLLVFTATSCTYTNNEKINYYSNEKNYIEITGIIEHIVFDDEHETLYLGFSNLSHKTDDNCFKVVGEAYSIMVTYKDHIHIGKTATFVTAPKYYGDGYVMPIVALSVDGLNILEYETGFSSLLDWLKK